jgi:hypothetical protein
MSRSALYLTGVNAHTLRLQFKDLAEYEEWDQSVTAIKGFIAWINTHVHDDNQRLPLYLQWRGMVIKFGDRWGADMVPQDIKDALKSVEEGVGAAVTAW